MVKSVAVLRALEIRKEPKQKKSFDVNAFNKMNVEKSKSTEKKLSRREQAYKRKMLLMHGQDTYPQHLIDRGLDQPKFLSEKSKYSKNFRAENFDERQPNSRHNLSLENFGIDEDDDDFDIHNERQSSKSRGKFSMENFDIEDNSEDGPAELKIENFLDNGERLLKELETDLIKA